MVAAFQDVPSVTCIDTPTGDVECVENPEVTVSCPRLSLNHTEKLVWCLLTRAHTHAAACELYRFG